jgi:hypothetical protein
VYPSSDAPVDDTVMGGQVIPRAVTKYAEIGVGEYFTNVKQIINRYNLLQSTAPLNGDYAINPYFWSAVSLNIGSGAIVAPNSGGDVMSYIAPMYANFRGSMKVSVARNEIFGAHYVNIQGYSSSGLNIDAATTTFGASTWTTPGSSTTPLNTGRVNFSGNNVYVRVPYYVDTLFSIVRPSITGIAKTDPDMPQVWANIEVPSSDGVTGYVLRAAADDFVFSYFLSTPLLFSSYV